MTNDRSPLTDAEAAAYRETLDHLYGRLRPIESRAETVLAVARSVGNEEAVARVEAIIGRLGDPPPPVGERRVEDGAASSRPDRRPE